MAEPIKMPYGWAEQSPIFGPRFVNKDVYNIYIFIQVAKITKQISTVN